MHMMSKKEQSSEELDTLRRSRTRTVVLTANSEVHTHEAAQVFVHDWNLFVTVQLLEATLAVLSLGKFFEDHGYSYEWVSGQKPRLTKEGKTITCQAHTVLRTQIRNVTRKRNANQGSTVFILTSQKTELATSAYEPKRQGLLAENALAKLYFRQQS